MNCSLRRILICLLLGALTTVAVAWLLAAFADVRIMGSERLRREGADEVGLSSDTPEEARFYSRGFGSLRVEWVLTDVGDLRHAFARQGAVDPDGVYLVDGPNPPRRMNPPYWLDVATPLPNNVRRVTDARGWPFLALVGQVEKKWVPGLTSLPVLPQAFKPSRPPLFISFRPIWPGFLIDTVLYAAMWGGVVVGFGATQRAFRRRRGRCPQCGYDLRGQSGRTSELPREDRNSETPAPEALTHGCPECGWGRG